MHEARRFASGKTSCFGTLREQNMQNVLHVLHVKHAKHAKHAKHVLYGKRALHVSQNIQNMFFKTTKHLLLFCKTFFFANESFEWTGKTDISNSDILQSPVACLTVLYELSVSENPRSLPFGIYQKYGLLPCPQKTIWKKRKTSSMKFRRSENHYWTFQIQKKSRRQCRGQHANVTLFGMNNSTAEP